MKKLLILLILIIIVVIGYLVVKPRPSNNGKPSISDINTKPEGVRVDLNGDGKLETLSIGNDDKGQYLVALDESGKEIGPHSLPLPVEPFSDSGRAIALDAKIKQQFVRFDFPVGPHSSNTLFFGLQQNTNEISLVCHDKVKTSIESCMFWSGEVGELITEDLDNDGNIEAVELVDEYPQDGQLTTEENDAISQATKDSESEVSAGMRRIAKREKGGRGRKVVWKIFSFDGDIFSEQTGDKFNEYYDLTSKYIKNKNPAYPLMIKRSEMSKDSEDYNLFMQQFWLKGA